MSKDNEQQMENDGHTRPRFRSMRLIAVMLGLGVLLSIGAGPLPASAATQGVTLGYNPGAPGQCTWLAELEFHDYTGTYIDTLGGNGNAMYWGANAAAHGWTVTSQPTVNSIVVFQPGVDGAGSVGHVAWVTSVSGSNISVVEMDFPHPYIVSTRSNVGGLKAGVAYILPANTTSAATNPAARAGLFSGSGRADRSR